MAAIETLIKAAQYIEQQEKLQLSPPSAATNALAVAFNNNVTSGLHLHHHNNNNNNNNINTNNNNINARSSLNPRHTISSSAPSAGATFQHVNGLTITSSNGGIVGNIAGISGSSNSQLITNAAAAASARNQRHNDYEFVNGNVDVTVVPAATSQSSSSSSSSSTSSSSSIAALSSSLPNGRSSEGRMSEDAFSSPQSFSNTSSNTSNSNMVLFLPGATEQQTHARLAAAPLQQQHQLTNTTKCTTTFTLVNSSKNAGSHNNMTIAENGAASKQMLLTSGLRIASPAATIGGIAGAASKPISILHAQQRAAVKSSPFAFGNASHSVPLTPPPVPSRKLVDTHTRIRSCSLSSNKFSANQLHLHNGTNGGNHMMVDDAPMSYVSAPAGGNHSPPRAGGNPYFQMISSAQQGGSQVTQTTPPICGSGRRRTISSNSNGAGTREVHNKLEKHRRAHLKECYETLKKELPLKDEDRKKTSNLAILTAALNHVQLMKQRQQELDSQIEEEATKKITIQKRLNLLKRELGPGYEQMFGNILGSIPSESENLNDTNSLSSGRGSMLYSSSSSLSSGGSNGSNTMSSPVGAGLQTAVPTAISPVISKTNSIINNVTTSASAAIATSPISNNNMLHQQQQQQHLKSSTSASANNSPVGNSAVQPLNGIVSVSTHTPLSLTAKNISATALTRGGSPTPSTPSPSPSSSSCVSSSSSLISSSPPMLNGGNNSSSMINGRNVTVNIPNGVKFQTSGGATIGTIGNGTGSAAATIIATSPTGAIVNGSNAYTQQPNATTAAVAVVATTSTNAHANNAATNSINNAPSTAFTMRTTLSSNYNGYQRHTQSRKTSLTLSDDVKNSNMNNNNNMNNFNIICASGSDDAITNNCSKQHSYEDGEQPAKFIKVYNGLVSGAATGSNGSNSLVVSVGANEIGRLPGGAELNILPATNGNGIMVNGMKNGGGNSVGGAFYHANGKLTLVNGGATAGGKNGNVLKDGTVSAGAAIGLTPLVVVTSAQQSLSSVSNALHYGGNYAHLIATTTPATVTNSAPASVAVTAAVPHEHRNGKFSLSLGGQGLSLINPQYLGGATSSMARKTAATSAAVNPTNAAAASVPAATKLHATTEPAVEAALKLFGGAGRQHEQLNATHNFPTFSTRAYATITAAASAMKASPTLSTTTTITKTKTTVPPITSSILKTSTS